MIEYKVEKGRDNLDSLWVVAQYLDDNRITTICFVPNAIWAQRIANALNQMEIES